MLIKSGEEVFWGNGNIAFILGDLNPLSTASNQANNFPASRNKQLLKPDQVLRYLSKSSLVHILGHCHPRCLSHFSPTTFNFSHRCAETVSRFWISHNLVFIHFHVELFF